MNAIGNQLKSCLLLIAGLLLVAGCQSVKPLPASNVERKIIDEKNYELGKASAASIGEPMIYRKRASFTLHERNDILTANEDFQIEVPVTLGGTRRISGLKGSNWSVSGTTEYKGRSHYVIELADWIAIMVEPSTGKIVTETGLGRNGVGVWVTTAVGAIGVSSPNLRLIETKRITVEDAERFVWYELIYTGKSGESIKLLYREYAPSENGADMIRSAFNVELEYDLSKSKEIAYKKIRILVAEASNTEIRFTVTNDI